MIGCTRHPSGSLRSILVIGLFATFTISLLYAVSAQGTIPTVSTLENPTRSVSIYYGGGASSREHWVETTLLFRNQHPNSTTFFMLQPSEYVYDNGSIEQLTGWFVGIKLFNSSGALFRDLGYFSDDTAKGKADLHLDPFDVYTLQARLHVPQDLVVGEEYNCLILVGGFVPFDPLNPGAQSVTSFIFKTVVRPTLSYYLTGRIYMPGGWEPASGAAVVIANGRSSESVALVSDAHGRFSYDLMRLPSGYRDSDAITVTASLGGLSGRNVTSVNIITVPVLGNYGTDCDIFLEEDREEPPFLQDNWLYILLLAVIVVLLISIERYRSKASAAPGKARGASPGPGTGRYEDIRKAGPAPPAQKMETGPRTGGEVPPVTARSRRRRAAVPSSYEELVGAGATTDYGEEDGVVRRPPRPGGVTDGPERPAPAGEGPEGEVPERARYEEPEGPEEPAGEEPAEESRPEESPRAFDLDTPEPPAAYGQVRGMPPAAASGALDEFIRDIEGAEGEREWTSTEDLSPAAFGEGFAGPAAEPSGWDKEPTGEADLGPEQAFATPAGEGIEDTRIPPLEGADFDDLLNELDRIADMGLWEDEAVEEKPPAIRRLLDELE